MASFSLLGELEEEDDDEDEKLIPDKPGGSVAVFWPLKLFLHTGHVSCCEEKKKKQETHKMSSEHNYVSIQGSLF